MKESATVKLKQSARWLAADMETPISLYLKTVGGGDGVLLESAEVDGRQGRYSLLACDPLAFFAQAEGKIWIGVKDERLAPLLAYDGAPFLEGLRAIMGAINIEPPRRGPKLPAITRAIYGFLGFGAASMFNPVLREVMPEAEADCQFMLPGEIFLFDHLYNRLCRLSLGNFAELKPETPSPDSPDPDLDKATSTPDEAGYKEYVRVIREALRQGEAIQVVPSARFCAPYAGDAFKFYRRLRRYNASPYTYYMRFPDITLFGASPEVMVRCEENVLGLSPIAGTRKRGASEREDARMAEELKNDPKERAEHVMLVDLGRNDLGRIAKAGTVRVDKYMEVEKFSHVMHLTSKISARLDDERDLDAIDVLAATFPAGTVSGAPKIRAMEIISRLENSPRGPYAGCVGWLGLDKGRVNMDMGITIRSGWLKDGRLCWQAGGGIVHDSDPELEWKEVRNKSAIMRLALMPEDENYVPVDR